MKINQDVLEGVTGIADSIREEMLYGGELFGEISDEYEKHLSFKEKVKKRWQRQKIKPYFDAAGVGKECVV